MNFSDFQRMLGEESSEASVACTINSFSNTPSAPLLSSIVIMLTLVNRKIITEVTTPSKFSKTDLYRWRQLFDIYLEARIFFSTRECDHGSRNSSAALAQLKWFRKYFTNHNPFYTYEPLKSPIYNLYATGRAQARKMVC